jgi:hypothetical protein
MPLRTVGGGSRERRWSTDDGADSGNLRVHHLERQQLLVDRIRGSRRGREAVDIATLVVVAVKRLGAIKYRSSWEETSPRPAG